MSLFWGSAGNAHTPHHTIDALSIVPRRDAPGEIFIVRGSWQLFRSGNGGASWREISNGLTSRYQYTSLTSLPLNDRGAALYLGTDGDGVFRSGDSGHSWVPVNRGLDEPRIVALRAAGGNDRPEVVFAITHAGSLYRFTPATTQWERCGLSGRRAVSLEVLAQPSRDPRALVGTAEGELILLEDDCGPGKVRTIWTGMGAITAITTLPGSSGDDDSLLIGTRDGHILRSLDGGKTFTKTGLANADGAIQAIAVGQKLPEGPVLLATSWNQAVFRSVDGGENWARHSAGLSTHSQANQPAFLSPQFRQIGFDDSTDSVYLAGFDGLFRSEDKGQSWRQVVTEPPGNIWSLAVSPEIQGQHVVALTTFDAGAYVKKSSTPAWRIANQGLPARRLRELVFSPAFGRDGLIFSTRDEGDLFLRSSNAGESWSVQSFDRGLYVTLKSKVLGALHHRLGMPASLTTDLITRDERIAANPKGLVVSPALPADGFVFVTTRFRGNYASSDSGETLGRVESPEAALWELAISPDFAHDSTMFASARERGVFRSTDAGQTWHPANRGLEFLEEWERFLADSDRAEKELGQSMFYDIKLAVSPGYAEDATLFAGGGEGLYRSMDGASRWHVVPSLADAYVIALAASPSFDRDGVVVVSVKGRGMWRSSDGGETFVPFARTLLESNHEVRHIRFSPAYAEDRTLYLASQEYVFTSTDGGDTWMEMHRPVRYENDQGQLELGGAWERVDAQQYSGGSIHRLAEEGGCIKFVFTGTRIDWIGPQTPGNLNAQIWIDGVNVTSSAHAHASNGLASKAIASIEGLAHGPHTLIIRAGSSEEADFGLAVDAFDVHGGRSAALK